MSIVDEVHAAVTAIEAGSVSTYGDIGKQIGVPVVTAEKPTDMA